MKNKYRYIGPVESFGKCICNRVVMETTATSVEKARSNIAYRYKRQHEIMSNAQIGLPGEIIKIS